MTVVREYEAIPEIAVDERPQRGTVVMKFGGTSVAGPERLRRVAKRLVQAHEEGNRVVAVLSAMGATTDELISLAHQVSARPDARELDMLISVGERISCALAAMAINDLGHRAVSLTGLAGRDRHRHEARQGEDRRRPRAPHPRVARPRRDRPRRRLPGRLHRQRRDHARTRRLGHDGRCPRRRARRRALRDLHRRRGRLHRRPADRPEREQAPCGQLRGDAGAGGVRREGAAAAVRRVRAQPRRYAARALDVRGRRGHLDRRGGREDAREGDDRRRHPRRRGGRVRGGGRRSGRAVPDARGRVGERRHRDPDRNRCRLLRTGGGPRRGHGRARAARRAAGPSGKGSARSAS